MPAALYLRKVDHPQAVDNYRVILKIDGTEYEIGSIGTKVFTAAETVWTWGIDTVIPMRAMETEGSGADRKDCEKQFRAAWERFSADEATLTEFLEMKRKARRR
jgi:hypothetical protein